MNTTTKTLRYYWRHVRRFPSLWIPVAVIMPLSTMTGNYLAPLALAAVLNRLNLHEYSAGKLWEDFGGLVILYIFLTSVGGLVLWRLFDLFYWRLEGHVQRSIYQEMFAHLVEQSANFHANQFAGSLVSAAGKLANAYVRLADTVLFQTAPLALGLVFVTIFMGSRAPIYAILLLGFSILYIIVSFVVSARVRHRGAMLASAESRQTGVLADALTNVMAIKSFAREHQEQKRFGAANDNVYRKLLEMARAFQKQQLYLNVVIGAMSGVALIVAIVSVVVFGANLATAFLIFSYTTSIVSQLFTFSNNALRSFNRAFGDARDMREMLEVKPEVGDPIHPETVKIHEGAIAFSNVSFTHAGTDDALFRDLSLSIRPGEKVGLVGHSGSGKTTFTRLLLRFSDIDGGAITIDGQNIAHITQADLRSHIAYVPQEPLLFHRTIGENISYGKLDATQSEIERVAKLAHAHEFVHQLPHGYDTLVGERGVKLSGGQRQRIAIARAMLKDAPILVLDEATSALDSESEVLIQDALWKLMEGRTAIVIAHRLSTIQKMDRIVVLDTGNIVERGSHQALLQVGGTYAKLWAHQSGGFIEE